MLHSGMVDAVSLSLDKPVNFCLLSVPDCAKPQSPRPSDIGPRKKGGIDFS